MFGQRVQNLVNQYNFELGQPQIFDERDRQSQITSQTGAQAFTNRSSPRMPAPGNDRTLD
jgi:hypothetical protein